VASSAWEVTEIVDLPEGLRYTLVLGAREVLVLHRPASWRAWNGEAVCEVSAGMKAAVLDYERA
jgi:hypothetical protein